MEEENIDIRDWIDAVLKRWRLLLLGSVLAGIVAVGLSLLAPWPAATSHSYEASVVVAMEGAETWAQYPELVETRPVLEDTIRDLGLLVSVDELRDKISASSVGGAPLLHITVRDLDRARAVDTANGVAQSLVDYVSASQELRSTSVREQLSRQLNNPPLEGSTRSDEALISALTPLALRPSIISPAEVWEDSAETNLTSVPEGAILRNLIIGVFLGSILSAMVAVGLEHIQSPIRSPVRSPDKLEFQFGLTRLELLPRWTKSGNPPHQLSAINQSEPVAVEAIREVAANLTFASKTQNARVLAVVSAETGDGRSDLVANAGVSLAKMWNDVVLVDADLRKPSLHHYFGLSNRVGLSNFVTNAKMEISDVIQETSYPRLKVITIGSISVDPVELLASPRTKGLLEQLENLASIVLVDTPPVMAAVDGVILASQVQGLVLLVNGESSRSETMKRALATLEKTGAPLLGYVWSKINLKRLDNYSSGRRYFQNLKPGADLYADPQDQLEMTGRKSQTNGTGVGLGSGFKMGKGIWRRGTGVTKVLPQLTSGTDLDSSNS